MNTPTYSVIPASIFHRNSGDEGDRTLNLRLAKPALSQLSYVPDAFNRELTLLGSPSHVGAHGFEPWTSALSGLRSSQLSYAPRYANKKAKPLGLALSDYEVLDRASTGRDRVNQVQHRLGSVENDSSRRRSFHHYRLGQARVNVSARFFFPAWRPGFLHANWPFFFPSPRYKPCLSYRKIGRKHAREPGVGSRRRCRPVGSEWG